MKETAMTVISRQPVQLGDGAPTGLACSPSPPPASTAEVIPIHVRRILVVDDDPGFGKFVRKIGQSCGYEVLLTGDAVSFEIEYARGKFDLIMLDLQMPGTDGVELLRLLADRGCTVPILVMSGFDAKVIDTAHRLGAARGLQMSRVLTKPIRATELRTILNEVKQGLDANVS
jgi:DNA-binding response OmpR family regulator